MMIMIIIAVISVAPYLTDKGDLTALYKINNNGYIKNLNINELGSHNTVFLARARARPPTHTLAKRRNATRG